MDSEPTQDQDPTQEEIITPEIESRIDSGDISVAANSVAAENGAIELRPEDLEALAAQTGVGVERWVNRDDGEKKSSTISFDAEKKEIIWEGKPLSEVLKGEKVLAKYNEAREKLANGEPAFWEFRNDKGLMEATIYKIDGKGGVVPHGLIEKEPDSLFDLSDELGNEEGSTDFMVVTSESSNDHEPIVPFSILNISERSSFTATAEANAQQRKIETQGASSEVKIDLPQTSSIIASMKIERSASALLNNSREVFVSSHEQVRAAEVVESGDLAEETGIRIFEAGEAEEIMHFNVDLQTPVEPQLVSGFAPIEFFAPPVVVAAPEEPSGISLIEIGSIDQVVIEPVITSEFSIPTVEPSAETVTEVKQDQVVKVEAVAPVASELVEDKSAISIQSVEAPQFVEIARAELKVVSAPEARTDFTVEVSDQIFIETEGSTIANTESEKVVIERASNVRQDPTEQVKDSSVIRTVELKAPRINSEPRIREIVPQRVVGVQPSVERAPISIRSTERVVANESVQAITREVSRTSERIVQPNQTEDVDARVSLREVPVGTSATLFRQENRRTSIEAPAQSARVVDINSARVVPRAVSEALQRTSGQTSVADIVDKVQEELDQEPQLSAIAA